jgi:hypothetical protein
LSYKSKKVYEALPIVKENAEALLAWGFVYDPSGISDNLIAVYDPTGAMISSIISSDEFAEGFEEVTT